jgi:hypothetical protein
MWLEEMINAYSNFVAKPEEGNHSKNLGVDGQ